MLYHIKGEIGGGGVHVYTDEKIGKKNNWYICQMIKRKQSNMG